MFPSRAIRGRSCRTRSAATGSRCFPDGRDGLAGASGRYHWVAHGISLDEIAKTLSFHLGRPVVDATGLKGFYDLDLRWVIDLAWAAERAGRPDLAREAANQPVEPSLPHAVEKQLGLKLTSKKGHGEVVSIDHLDKTPVAN